MQGLAKSDKPTETLTKAILGVDVSKITAILQLLKHAATLKSFGV